MEKQSQEMQEYLAKKNKAPGRIGEKRSAGKRIKSKYVSLVNFIKKWSYTLLKMGAFVAFLYQVEMQFYLMRRHIAKNGGLRRQNYGSHRAY